MAHVLAAATLVAGLSSAHGMYVQQERFPWYYADGLDNNNFWANSIASAPASKRVNTFAPSVSKRTLIGTIDFPAQERPKETRIYRGLIDPGLCTEGDYLFRVTSDDAAHLFLDGEMVIDNGDIHQPHAHTIKVSLKRDVPVKFELWWGNHLEGSTLKFEYCVPEPRAAATDLLRTLEDGEVGQEAFRLLSDVEVAFVGCAWTTDLSGIFQKQGGPVVRRCDYSGAQFDRYDWFVDNADGNSDKFLPEMCAYEVGGVIGAEADHDGKNQYTDSTSTFYATISPRATGVHTFWAQADDGAVVYVVKADGSKTLVVDNGGAHGPQWRHGSITLNKGQQYELKVFWANGGGPGKLEILYEDPMTEGPSTSIIPILLDTPASRSC